MMMRILKFTKRKRYGQDLGLMLRVLLIVVAMMFSAVTAGAVTVTVRTALLVDGTLEYTNTACGTATGGGTYMKDASVTLTATPNEDYCFHGWVEMGSSGDVIVCSDAIYTFIATADCTLTAVFSNKTESNTTPKNIDYNGGTITQDENGYTVAIYNDFNALPLPIGDDENIINLTYIRKIEGPIPFYYDKEIDGKPARLYTLCLPFAPISANGVNYYTLSSATATTLTFSEVTGAPMANTPYLVVITGNIDIEVYCYEHVVESMDIKSVVRDGYTFTGTFKGLDNDAASGKYILQTGGKWSLVPFDNASVFIPPFRAYIIAPAADARMLDSDFGDDTTTIQNIRTVDNDGTECWYDLNGRPVSKPITNGIYIHNSKKITIK